MIEPLMYYQVTAADLENTGIDFDPDTFPYPEGMQKIPMYPLNALEATPEERKGLLRVEQILSGHNPLRTALMLSAGTTLKTNSMLIRDALDAMVDPSSEIPELTGRKNIDVENLQQYISKTAKSDDPEAPPKNETSFITQKLNAGHYAIEYHDREYRAVSLLSGENFEGIKRER